MRSAIKDSTAAVDAESRAEVGSSRRRTRDRSISARTSPSRCRSPVESLWIGQGPQLHGNPNLVTSGKASSQPPK
jgi:hypothetical protein